MLSQTWIDVGPYVSESHYSMFKWVQLSECKYKKKHLMFFRGLNPKDETVQMLPI